jgi:fluoroacetyl-CoA thioesterase
LKPEFTIGLSSELAEETKPEHAASHLGTGTSSVYSTPSMIGLMERAATQLVRPYLEDGESSVGTKVNISHIAATPIGMKVRATAAVKEINGRRVLFAVEAYNENAKIGEGTHERAIINVNRFMSKS